MPKEIRSAAEVLGEAQPETATGAPEAPAAPPLAPAPDLAPEPAPEEQAGFAAPPPAEESAAAPATVEQLLTASGSLAQSAPPPVAPAPTLAKEYVQPAKPETLLSQVPEVVEAPKPVAAAPAARSEWKFVKNIHPGEKIVFKDGTEFVMKSTLCIVRDRVLAEKILAVKEKYNIVEQ